MFTSVDAIRTYYMFIKQPNIILLYLLMPIPLKKLIQLNNVKIRMLSKLTRER